MIKTIWVWFGYISLAVVVAFILFLYLVELWYFIKCFKIKRCYDKNCKFHEHCWKYKDIFTKENLEKLLELLDQ